MDLDSDDDRRPDSPPIHHGALDPPSALEVRLAQRVSTLEQERDQLAAELAAFKARGGGTTIPVPPEPTHGPLTIPQNVLPVLSLLRGHIAHLTRDNDALRYTFLGPSNAARLETAGVDLEEVLERVKELIRENEELGEMILESGREGHDEWQRALEESKAVIQSLDGDLSHHLSVVQSTRAELEAYKKQYGPLSKPGSRPDPGRSNRGGDGLQRSQSARQSKSGGGKEDDRGWKRRR